MNQSEQNGTGRIPPQAVEIEETILGSILTDPVVISEALVHLVPDDFYKPGNRLIFEGVISLFNENKPVDMITVGEYLANQNNLDQAGGKGYIEDLTYSVSSSANIEYYCQIIREKAIRRRLITSCNEIIKDSFNAATDTLEVLDTAQSKVFSVTRDTGGRMLELHEVMMSLSKDVDQIQKQGKPIGLRTGLDIDNTLQGFQNSKMYVIGARPSMGKTAFSLTIMRRLSMDGHKTGILSLETSHKSIGTRLVSQVSGLAADRIVSGQMTGEEMKRFSNSCSTLSEYGMIIDDEPALTGQKLRAKCRLMVKKGVKIIFVDFLQLLQEEAQSKHLEIGKLTKILKQTSKELDIPMVVLSQLNRKLEDRNNKRPQMSDLRESGSIEEDADSILFLYRPEYYGVKTTEDGRSTAGLCEVIIAKNKDGKTGFHEQHFIADQMRFENLAYQHPTGDPIKEPSIPPQPHYLDDNEDPF